MNSISRTIQVIGDLSECIRSGITDVQIEAANAAKGLISERVFTFSAGVDDSQHFGTYRSESYKKKRQAAGNQTNIKDLQFTSKKKRQAAGRQTNIKDSEFASDFRNDFNLGEYNGNVAIGFSEIRSANIVKGQEEGSKDRSGKFVQQIGFPIFSANEEEIDVIFDDYISKGVDKIIEECLKN